VAARRPATARLAHQQPRRQLMFGAASARFGRAPTRTGRTAPQRRPEATALDPAGVPRRLRSPVRIGPGAIARLHMDPTRTHESPDGATKRGAGDFGRPQVLTQTSVSGRNHGAATAVQAAQRSSARPKPFAIAPDDYKRLAVPTSGSRLASAKRTPARKGLISAALRDKLARTRPAGPRLAPGTKRRRPGASRGPLPLVRPQRASAGR
jgi:hypothetical protein